jgi:hypothetical protein
LKVSYRWDPGLGQPEDFFSPELSLFTPLELRPEPEAQIWSFPIETVAKSERGFDRTRQGDSVTLRWPVRLGEATVKLTPASLTLTAEVDPSRSALTLGLADSAAAASAEP